MKRCFKCGVEKDLSAFYKHKRMRDGHLNKCKECTKADVSKHREENIDLLMEYDRKRANLPHRVTARKEYAKTKAGRLASAKGQERYRQRYPEKHEAQRKVKNAVRYGKLTRGVCEVCGSSENIHAHHEDYTKPLDVIWICQAHHAELHKQKRKQK